MPWLGSDGGRGAMGLGSQLRTDLDINVGALRRGVGPPMWLPCVARPLLTIFLDRGPDQFSAVNFAVSKLRLRIFPLWDPFHEVANDLTNALKGAGLKPLLHELQHVFNFSHGPWQSCDFFRQVREAVSSWVADASVHDDIFQLLGPKIAADKGTSMNTMEQAMELFRGLPLAQCLAAKGGKVKLRVWFSIINRLDSFHEEWHEYLMALCVHGQMLGVWGSAAEMPMWEVKSQVPAPAAADADDRVEQLRTKCKNSMHLAAMILGDPTTKPRAMVILEVARPLWSAFTDMQKNLTDERYVSAFYKFFAMGSPFLVVCRIWQTLLSAQKLQRIGFSNDVRQGINATGQKTKHIIGANREVVLSGPETDEDSEELALVDCTHTFARELIKQRSLSILMHSEGYPGKFAMLIAEDRPYKAGPHVDETPTHITTQSPLEIFPEWVGHRSIVSACALRALSTPFCFRLPGPERLTPTSQLRFQAQNALQRSLVCMSGPAPMFAMSSPFPQCQDDATLTRGLAE